MSLADDVVGHVSQDELVELALALGNIDSAGPTEGPAADYVHDWLADEGFATKKVGLLADRYNVLARLPGTGGGYSLLFNSHLDTAIRNDDRWTARDSNNPIHHSAWVEGGHLVGEGIANDKGPMAAFMIAAKAVKAAGISLRGDLLLTAVIAETSGDPADDEPPGYLMETRDLGARYLATHGAIADYTLIAEGTGFSIVSVEAGEAWYRISWLSDEPGFYTPYLPDRTTPEASPNMIVRASKGVSILEDWAAEYQVSHARQYNGGPVVPKAQVAAIRGGASHFANVSPQVCSAYLGAFITPDADPLAIRDEIAEALAAGGVAPSEIALYHYRRGYDATNVERLSDAVLRAHRATMQADPPAPDPATSSMWRDMNIWNELGVPALTYGPRSASHAQRRALTIESLYQAACVYARVIVEICNQRKSNTVEPSAAD